MAGKDEYSKLLQDFACPLLDAKDTSEIFMGKINVAQIVWNYCIAKELKLALFDELHNTLVQQYKIHPELKLVFDDLVKFKRTRFKQYKNFISKVELREKSKGIKTLYVESILPAFVEKILDMAKLGTKGKPAIVKVQTQERAYEIMAICKSHDWQVMVGIEPENAENIDDIKTLERELQPVLKLNAPPSRNAPCPCGSGKQYKRCCGK